MDEAGTITKQVFREEFVHVISNRTINQKVQEKRLPTDKKYVKLHN